MDCASITAAATLVSRLFGGTGFFPLRTRIIKISLAKPRKICYNNPVKNKNAAARGCWNTREPAQVNQAPIQRPELAAPHDKYNIFSAPFQGVSSLLPLRAVFRIKKLTS